MAWLAVPLLPLARGGGGGPRLSPGQALDDGGVHHGVFHVRLIRDGIEKPLENIGFHPVAIPLEDGVPMAERGRQVAPRAASSRNPQHCLYKATVIRAAAAGVRRLPQAMRLHLRPLGVRQHKPLHPALEPHHAQAVNPKSQQALVREPAANVRFGPENEPAAREGRSR